MKKILLIFMFISSFSLANSLCGLDKAVGDKTKAIGAYQTYIEQMKAKGKSKKIPQIVKDRVLGK